MGTNWMGQRRASEAWEGATLGVGTDKALEAGKVLGGDEGGELQSCGRNAKRRDSADLKDSKTVSVTRFLKVGPFSSKISDVERMLELACTGL